MLYSTFCKLNELLRTIYCIDDAIYCTSRAFCLESLILQTNCHSYYINVMTEKAPLSRNYSGKVPMPQSFSQLQRFNKCTLYEYHHYKSQVYVPFLDCVVQDLGGNLNRAQRTERRAVVLMSLLNCRRLNCRRS